MNPGELNKRVTLMYADPGSTNYNDGVKKWASIKPLRVKELIQAKVEYQECTTIIKIRYLKDIDSTWRIRFEDTVYEIIGIIDPNLMHRELQLLCKVVQL